MDTLTILSYINLILAFVAVPPSIILIRFLVKERIILDTRRQRLNNTLTTLFGGMALASIINSAVSAVFIFGGGRVAHDLSAYRGIFINLFFSFISWSMFIIHKHSIKD